MVLQRFSCRGAGAKLVRQCGAGVVEVVQRWCRRCRRCRRCKRCRGAEVKVEVEVEVQVQR
mgnify:CR=1 FL=1